MGATKDIEERKRIGRQIAALRKAQGLTQRTLADKAGVLAPHIARIETGTYSVGFDTLQTIAAALGGRVEIIIK